LTTEIADLLKMPFCFRLFLPICSYHSVCHIKCSPFCFQTGSGKHPDTTGQNKSWEANGFSTSQGNPPYSKETQRFITLFTRACYLS